MDPVAVEVVPAPWGSVHVAATRRGVVAIEQLVTTAAFRARLGRRFTLPGGAARDIAARRVAGRAAEQLVEYLGLRRREFDLPVAIAPGAGWDREVLAAVRAVPWGAVTSYGRVARRIGRPGAARAVGGAVGRNPVAIVIPCHRVIAGDGSIGGYGGDWFGSREALLDVKRALLCLEGITLPVAHPRLTPEEGRAPGSRTQHRTR